MSHPNLHDDTRRDDQFITPRLQERDTDLVVLLVLVCGGDERARVNKDHPPNSALRISL